MKANKLRYSCFLLFLIFLIACSTKKDRFINRQFQAMNTKYNVMYNGNIALDKGIEEVKLKYTDNFWEVLPIERMQPAVEEVLPGQQRNANFDRAEEKAVKAIQKRSMNIDGKEKNPQIDEAHLLLGKARYYDQRYVPALEAFNYILYKYPESDKIAIAKIWRERTNMRMENDELAIKNLRKLLNDIKFKDQVYADANATLAQAFLNTGQRDSAIVRLRRATQFTKLNEEKARYRFILGQLFELAGEKDSAYVAFQSVIDMKRKSPRRYVIQAHIKQAGQYDYAKGDTLAFTEKYADLLKDRENRPFLDVLNHQMGLFYDKKNNHPQAIKYYNKSLRLNPQDQYLVASNYRNLADIYFDTAKYQDAGLYYDSTLVRLKPRTREHKLIKKKRDNLEDVIKYEAIAQKNDSILNVMALSDADKKGFYEDYIARLKKADAAKAELEKKEQEKLARASRDSDDSASDDDMPRANTPGKTKSPEDRDALNAGGKKPLSAATIGPKQQPGAAGSNTFYFYNTASVSYGKLEFRKKWGDRKIKNNWRLSALAKEKDQNATEEETGDTEKERQKEAEQKVDVRYTPEFYLTQLPKSKREVDSLGKERNFAYYQLGVIYKEKFKEYKLAAGKLEQLLRNNPEERLVLPTMYNLYKIYEIINKSKAAEMKAEIISKYPNSRYAQILSSGASSQELADQSPEAAYDRLFRQYENYQYREVLPALEKAVDQFTGEEIVPKLELLKAHTIGKLKGIPDYKTALNFVALNYPSSEEGKKAEGLLSKDILELEQLQFDAEQPKTWKIIYKINYVETPETKVIKDKLKKFVSERTAEKLRFSQDTYTITEDFIVIHGIATEDKAKDIASILKDYKDYNIQMPSYVISDANYQVVLAKKNFADYLLPHPKPTPKVAIPSKQESKALEEPKMPVMPKKQNNPAQNGTKKPDDGKQPQKQQTPQNPQDGDDPLPENSLPPTPKRPK